MALQIQRNSIKIPTAYFFFFFCTNGQADPKTHTVMLNSQVNLEKKKKKGWRTHIPNFKTYYNITVIQTVWYYIKIDTQINDIELGVQKETHISMVN